MPVKTQFEVVSKGAFVAGGRSPGVGKTISLTEEQARYPLISGEIKPTESPLQPADDESRREGVGGKPGKQKA
jgi:hypothetical protein